jgi:hypothetical protein
MSEDNGGSGVNAVAIVVIVVILLLVGYFVFNSGMLGGGGGEKSLNVNIKTPAAVPANP